MVALWLSKEERDALKELAAKQKTSMADILRSRLDEHIKSKKEK